MGALRAAELALRHARGRRIFEAFRDGVLRPTTRSRSPTGRPKRLPAVSEAMVNIRATLARPPCAA